MRVFQIVCVLILSTLPAAYAFEPGGFADVTYTKGTDGSEQQNGNFALGQLDFYVAQPIGEKTDILVEFVIEGDSTGDFGVDLERLQVGYSFNDALRVWAGRFHNILGYWNTAYHHGAIMQTSIERPRFLRFEDDGGVLPVHLVGVWLTGKYAPAPGQFQYGMMVGNGPKISNGVLEPNNIADDNKNKAVSFRLHFLPSAIPGLMAGISGNVGTVDVYQDDVPLTGIDQQILGFDITYFGHNAELLSEYYRMRNEDPPNVDYSSDLFYVQAGYKFAGKVTPYMRYELMSIEPGDPYYLALGVSGEHRVLGGVRYDVNMSSALKAEVRWIDPANAETYEEFGVQWAFGF